MDEIFGDSSADDGLLDDELLSDLAKDHHLQN
jgi:hypothetical protein